MLPQFCLFPFKAHLPCVLFASIIEHGETSRVINAVSSYSIVLGHQARGNLNCRSGCLIPFHPRESTRIRHDLRVNFKSVERCYFTLL